MSKNYVMTDEEARLHLMNAQIESDKREAALTISVGDDDDGDFEDPKLSFNQWNNVVKAYERLITHLMKLPEDPDIAVQVGFLDSAMRTARSKANALAYRARKAKAPPNQ